VTPGLLVPITSLDEFDRLVSESATRPVLLFKHSRSCGTSAEAYDELLDHLSRLDGAPANKTTSAASASPLSEVTNPPATYAMVTVQTHRDVSTTIAARLGVRHETPQALVIRDGRVVWTASHFRVTAEAIASAVRAAAAPSRAAVPAVR
jgi:hypothetical protein